MPGILAVDQNTVSGWAWGLPGKEPICGSKRMGWAPRKENGKTISPWYGLRFFEFRQFFLHQIGLLSPDHLVWEAPFMPRPDRSNQAKPLNPSTSRLTAGFVAQLELLAEEFGIDHREYQSPAVAKFFTGDGRFPGETPEQRTEAKKSAVRAACVARGWPVRNYNESDALALLCYAEHHLYPRESLSRRKVLKVPTEGMFAVS